MARQNTGKIGKARQLWKEMPSASLDEFMKAFAEKHGEPISQPAVYAGKRAAGLTKTRNKKSPKPTIVDLKKVRDAAIRHGGARRLLASLDAMEGVADSVGGFAALRDCLEFLNEK